MANKHTKRYSTLLAIREMQIKAAVIYDYTHIRMAKIQKQHAEKLDCYTHILLVGMSNGTATLGNSLAVSYKTKYALTILLGIYPKNMKIYGYTKTSS